MLAEEEYIDSGNKIINPDAIVVEEEFVTLRLKTL